MYYLESINALPRYLAYYFILVVEMPPEHLCRLVDRVLDLHGNPSTCLRLFDNLIGIVISWRSRRNKETAHFLSLMVNFQ